MFFLMISFEKDQSLEYAILPNDRRNKEVTNSGCFSKGNKTRFSSL